MNGSKTFKILKGNGFSLVELLIALTIMAVIAVPVTQLLIATSSANNYITAEAQVSSQMELAWGRMSANIRAATAAPTITTTANGQSEITVVVPSVASPGTTYTVSYYCTGASAPYAFVEDDSRYDAGGTTPNTIVSQVSSFSASIATSPTTTVTFDLQLNSCNGKYVYPQRRHVTIYCRNF